MKITHTPEDMTATVAADAPLAGLQAELAKHGQWLPVDPPGPMTIRELLDTNASGPRRFGYGQVREHLIGITVRLPDGRVIKSGGKVVKNVAGYDLGKLFVGAHRELGAIIEATFKLRPLPETERFVQCRCASLDEAGNQIAAVLDSAVMPVVLDLIPPATVVVGFAGVREDVEWQLAQLGWSEPATPDFDQPFPNWVSVLPSKLIETLKELRVDEFVCRAGNGAIGINGTGEPHVATRLEQRVREAFGG